MSDYGGDYLQSDRWRAIRAAMLWIANYRCQVCGLTDQDLPLEVHHGFYGRIGCERPEDLIVLCQRCHSRFHEQASVESRKSDRF